MKKLFIEPTVCEQALLLIPMCSGLQSLTLVLDDITDELLVSISQNLPKLTELCLADKLKAPNPSLNDNLSNNGIHTISLCRNLKRLSLTRGSGYYYPEVAFVRVNDVGILHLANGLNQLEFLKLSGFYNVTDAGYKSIIHSCKKLRRFEIKYANLLSDLAFNDFVNNAPACLVDVRLNKCNLWTSETAASLCFCENLKDLDLSGCKNIGDLSLKSISKLCKLAELNLSGADLSDDGLLSLRACSSPITYLSLRECRRITDEGMLMFFNGETSIFKTLTTLDVGRMSAVLDQVIATISKHCKQLANLSIRYCFCVTNASIKALGLKTVPMRRLDLYECRALSVKSFEYLGLPYFKNLRWLGVGQTKLNGEIPLGLSNIRLADGLASGLVDLLVSRCGLHACLSGCEMYCNVGAYGSHIRIF